MRRVEEKNEGIARIEKMLSVMSVDPEQINPFLESVGSAPINQKIKMNLLLSRPHLSLEDLSPYLPQLVEGLSPFDDETISLAEVNIKYKGYIEREKEMVESQRRTILAAAREGVAAALRGMAARPSVVDYLPQISMPTLVVVHGISLPPGHFGGDGVVGLFTNSLDPTQHPFYATVARLRVSAHFFIRRDGALLQFVACADRAWHAGASSWRGRERCNDFSIGVELEGTDDRAYTVAQYRRLAGLLKALARRYPIEAAVGHSDVAPGRKTDPGPAFDWTRLGRLLGLSRRLPAPHPAPRGA